MNLLPFGQLSAYRPRQFVPSNVDLGDATQIAPLFDHLETQAAQCVSLSDLERWLLDWSELSAALDEESSRRYIAMTCHTENADAERAYLHFVEQIEPQLKPRQFKLSQIYLAQALRGQLTQKRYEVFDRDTKMHVELFRPENVPLETEEAKLGQQYQKLSGSLTVQFQGQERTLVQMARYLEEPDRALRQEAWRLVAERRLQEAQKFEQFFDQLVKLRQQIAVNAGFKNYLEYAFKARGRFDYTPEDCRQFHDAIEQEIMPVLRELQSERRAQLGIAALRPWDLAVDPLNRPPLHPFETVDQMVARAQRIFNQLDRTFGDEFRMMENGHLLDLANRKGKAPGGYQLTLNEARLPFIFMNAVGLQRDVETILHEAGHAFHALATRDEDLYSYRHGPIEFCEVASMSMELLGNEYLEEFYAAAESNRARRKHLEGIVEIFPWIATVDAFQHWIYSHPGHSRAERTAAWLKLMDRFGGNVDWSGHENVRANLWHRQLHIFLHPFYYVEYGIAQLGALQVWMNFRREKVPALKAYRQALALGGSRPLPELFAAAGCPFDFGAKTVRPLVGMIREELAKLKT
jgi:oligoendopeptidase F